MPSTWSVPPRWSKQRRPRTTDKFVHDAHVFGSVAASAIRRSYGDIQKIKAGDIQVVKFHGDFDDEESIILTESQYFARLNFEHPLDIKLQGDT
jgi:hypothetical protein